MNRNEQSFFNILTDDVNACLSRIKTDDTAANRRDLIRAIFAAIEGINWQLKELLLSETSDQLSPHEYAALKEESYQINKKGEVVVVDKFLPLGTSIRMAARLVQKFSPRYELDFSDVGWENLKHAIDTRNRLVHPKSKNDLAVSDTDLEKSFSGFSWILKFKIAVQQEVIDLLESRARKS
jgi:hypothetical protein